jgi:putative endonuclease
VFLKGKHRYAVPSPSFVILTTEGRMDLSLCPGAGRRGFTMKDYWVYILTDRHDKVMYVGVTNDLLRRLYEHKHHLTAGFTARYNVHRLVYCESTPSIDAAIAREKQLKGWRREKKNALVETMNPEWKDLSQDW